MLRIKHLDPLGIGNVIKTSKLPGNYKWSCLGKKTSEQLYYKRYVRETRGSCTSRGYISTSKTRFRSAIRSVGGLCKINCWRLWRHTPNGCDLFIFAYMLTERIAAH